MTQYKLVPVEPTEEMRNAATKIEWGGEEVDDCWRSMLAAAPEPDAKPVANIRTWHKNGRQHAELLDWGCGIEALPDGVHDLYTAPQPAPEPDVEPVAWMFPDDLELFKTREMMARAYSIKASSPDQGTTVPLYTHPQPAKPPLTEAEFAYAWRQQTKRIMGTDKALLLQAKQVTEAAHGIGSLGGSRMANTATDPITDLEQDNRAIRALIERLERENAVLLDSCAAKADRIDRLGEAVERLQAERGELLEALKQAESMLVKQENELIALGCDKPCAESAILTARFAQMAQEAGIAWKDSGALTQGHTLTDLETLVELVVKECAKVAKLNVINISTQADADFVETQIKRHFGINL